MQAWKHRSMLKTLLTGCELLQRESINQWLISSPAHWETDWGRQVNDGEASWAKIKAGEGRQSESGVEEIKES